MTKIENILVNLHKEKFSYEKFYGKMLDYTKQIKTLDKWDLYAVSTKKSQK